MRTFGIELECFLPVGVSHAEAARRITEATGFACRQEHYGHDVPTAWKIVTDGSLNDYQRGAELVSPVLTNDEAGIAQARKVIDALRAIGATVNRKCGLHVHVGVDRAAPVTFFKALVKAYARFENAIDGVMPPSRRGSANAFCRPVNAARADAALTVRQLIEFTQSLYQQGRYSKLNLHSFLRQPTVEFRQHSGTVESTKVLNWVAVCIGMVERAFEEVNAAAPVADVRMPVRVRPGSKLATIVALLTRPEGCTRADVMRATGWPSVSMQQQAEAAGLTLRTVKRGRVAHYYADIAAGTWTQQRPATPVGAAEYEANLDGFLRYAKADTAVANFYRERAEEFAGRA